MAKFSSLLHHFLTASPCIKLTLFAHLTVFFYFILWNSGISPILVNVSILMFPFTVILLCDFNRYVIILIYLSYKKPNPLGHCFLFVSEHCWERFKPHNGRDWLIIYQPFAFLCVCSGRRYFPDFFTIVWLCGLF